MSNHDWWEEQRDAQLREPRLWWIWAQTHFRAAELIWDAYAAARSKALADPHTYFRPGQPAADDLALSGLVFYHLAVVLELVVKGHLVRRDPQIVEQREFYTHNLEALCARIHMPFSTREKYLVRQLRHLVEWRGRYPTPTVWKSADWNLVPDDEGRNTMPGMIAPDDYELSET